MPSLEAILAVTLAGFALSATPGPSMLYVLSRSVGQSRAAGLASALGLGLGGVLLAVATALGLAVVLTTYDWLLSTLKYLGSAYLIYLGVEMIKDARANSRMDLKVETLEQQPLGQIVGQGIFVELLNPKTVLFFALFLPPFVSASGLAGTDPMVKWQLLTLGVIVPLTALPADIVVAFLGGTMAQALQRNRRVRECLAWAAGIILVCIAFNLHLNII
ncbi:MAG: LysE family translocator [Pseudomonadota bacterium]